MFRRARASTFARACASGDGLALVLRLPELKPIRAGRCQADVSHGAMDDTIAAMWDGRVLSLHLARAASAPMESVPEVRAVPGRGLEGDRYYLGTGFYSKKLSPGGREVTLIETEAVDALDGGIRNSDGERYGIKLAAADSRRNIATSGVPLNHLVDREFWVGAVRMRGTRLCEPCRHLDELTQTGVMAGLVHRGGLGARMITEGVIRGWDVVRPA